jgi:hypothetical protein
MAGPVRRSRRSSSPSPTERERTARISFSLREKVILQHRGASFSLWEKVIFQLRGGAAI